MIFKKAKSKSGYLVVYLRKMLQVQNCVTFEKRKRPYAVSSLLDEKIYSKAGCQAMGWTSYTICV